jgi:hypothetical protein
LRGIGSISVKQALIIDGVENNLFCTFDDPTVALYDLMSAIPEYLEFLKEEYDLNEITLENISIYEEKMFEYEQLLIGAKAIEKLETVRKESEILASFCRIYSLESRNNMAIQTVYKNSSTSAKREELIDLIPLLPSFAPLAEEFNTALIRDKQAFQSESTYDVVNPISYGTVKTAAYGATMAAAPYYGSYDAAKAVAYAYKYAINPNSSGAFGYRYFGTNGDCTNFASQILYEGGIIKEYTVSELTGWWYSRAGIDIFDMWSYSWSVSSYCVTYMGRSAESKNFPALSLTVQYGDIIAIDNDGVGNYHHLGCVSTIGTYGTYNGMTYRDFIIAQHSSNYYEWVSSPLNGWETHSPTAMYCIVRR